MRVARPFEEGLLAEAVAGPEHGQRDDVAEHRGDADGHPTAFEQVEQIAGLTLVEQRVALAVAPPDHRRQHRPPVVRVERGQHVVLHRGHHRCPAAPAVGHDLGRAARRPARPAHRGGLRRRADARRPCHGSTSSTTCARRPGWPSALPPCRWPCSRTTTCATSRRRARAPTQSSGPSCPLTRGLAGYVAMSGQALAIDEPAATRASPATSPSAPATCPRRSCSCRSPGRTGAAVGVLTVLDRTVAAANALELGTAFARLAAPTLTTLGEAEATARVLLDAFADAVAGSAPTWRRRCGERSIDGPTPTTTWWPSRPRSTACVGSIRSPAVRSSTSSTPSSSWRGAGAVDDRHPPGLVGAVPRRRPRPGPVPRPARSRRRGAGPTATARVRACAWRSSTRASRRRTRRSAGWPTSVDVRVDPRRRSGVVISEGPARRPLRPRHGVRRDHPLARPRRRAGQRARARRRPPRQRHVLRRGHRLVHPQRHPGRQPEPVDEQRGLPGDVLGSRRSGGVRARRARVGDEQRAQADDPQRARRRLLRGLRARRRPRAVVVQPARPGRVGRRRDRPRGRLERRRHAAGERQQLRRRGRHGPPGAHHRRPPRDHPVAGAHRAGGDRRERPGGHAAGELKRRTSAV